MLYMVCATALILFGNFGVATLSGRRPEETLGFCTTATVTALFVFYCFNILYVGFSIVVFAMLFCGIYAGWHHFYKKNISTAVKNIASKMFTPAIIVFIFLTVMIYIATSSGRVTFWDETRLWGTLPKALYFSPKLHLGSGAWLALEMQAYPPGGALFEAFIARFVPHFGDRFVFFAYALLCATLFPITIKGLRWSKAYLIPVFCALFFFLPVAFYSSNFDGCNYYISLYIDPMLGIFAGFCFFLAFEKPFSDIFCTLRFAVALAATVLIKDSGAGFALCAFTVATVEYILFSKKSKTDIKPIRTLISFAVPALCIAIWKLTLLSYKLPVQTHRIDYSGITSDKMRGFLLEILYLPIMLVKYSFFETTISAIVLFIAMLISAGFLYMCINKEDKKRFIIIFSGIIVSNFIYLIGLFVLYCGIFGGEPLSFSRYLCAMLLCDLLFLVGIATTIGLAGGFNSTVKKTILSAGVIFILMMFPLQNPVRTTMPWIEAAQIITQGLENNIDIGDNGKEVLLLFPESGGLMVENIYEYDVVGLGQQVNYNLLGSGIFTYADALPPLFSEPIEDEQLFTEKLNGYIEHLHAGGYDYLYVQWPDARWSDKQKQVLKDFFGADLNFSLFRVTQTENGAKLEFIDYFQLTNA